MGAWRAPITHQKEGTLALVVCTGCGCDTGKCNKGLAEQCPKMLKGDQGRILRKIIAGWHPRHRDAQLDAAALAKVEALKLMEEADLRHSRVNVRRKRASVAPEEEGPGPLPRQGKDCVARRIWSSSAQATIGAMPRPLTARQDPPSIGWVGGGTPQARARGWHGGGRAWASSWW